jgi:hypothetical protein
MHQVINVWSKAEQPWHPRQAGSCCPILSLCLSLRLTCGVIPRIMCSKKSIYGAKLSDTRAARPACAPWMPSSIATASGFAASSRSASEPPSVTKPCGRDLNFASWRCEFHTFSHTLNTNRLGKCNEYTAFDESDKTTCSGVGLTGKPCVNRRPTEEQLGGKRWQWHEKPSEKGIGKKFCETCRRRLYKAGTWGKSTSSGRFC